MAITYTVLERNLMKLMKSFGKKLRITDWFFENYMILNQQKNAISVQIKIKRVIHLNLKVFLLIMANRKRLQD